MRIGQCIHSHPLIAVRHTPCFRADVRSGKEELYRGLSQAVTVAVLFVILHDSFRSKLAKQGQRGSESEGARLSIEEALSSAWLDLLM